MTLRPSLRTLVLLAACGSGPPDATGDASTSSGESSGTSEAITTSGGMDLPPELPDGDPTRMPCTNDFGDGLSSQFGRLDGLLVAVVEPGAHGCNGDQDHLHLQVLADGQVYDVAMNMDVQMLRIEAAPTGAPWTEGWHTGVSFDYVGDLGTHSADYDSYTQDVLAGHIEEMLVTVNHISVYGTGYGPTGMHEIHRKYTDHDGALVLQPLTHTPAYLLFHFDDQSF